MSYWYSYFCHSWILRKLLRSPFDSNSNTIIFYVIYMIILYTWLQLHPTQATLLWLNGRMRKKRWKHSTSRPQSSTNGETLVITWFHGKSLKFGPEKKMLRLVARKCSCTGWTTFPLTIMPATWECLYELLVSYEIGHVAAKLKRAVENPNHNLQVSSILADF